MGEKKKNRSGKLEERCQDKREDLHNLGGEGREGKRKEKDRSVNGRKEGKENGGREERGKKRGN